MQAVSNIDLERFMVNWYVIANIPTFAEREAVNSLEKYRLNDDGTIAIKFTFNKKHPEGTAKTLRMTGFANDKPNNGIWRMQWIWPIKADYRIAYLDENYQFAIIGRNKRDYVWVMSRAPNTEKGKLNERINFAASLGYHRTKIQLTSWQQPLKEAARTWHEIPKNFSLDL